MGLNAPPDDLPAHAFWFGEEQGRYVVAAEPVLAALVLGEAAKAAIAGARRLAGSAATP